LLHWPVVYRYPSSSPTRRSSDLSNYTVRDLGLLTGTDTSMGTDVNDNGEVVGNTSYRGQYKHSFYWSASAGMVDMGAARRIATTDRKSTRLNSSHLVISYAVFCL